MQRQGLDSARGGHLAAFDPHRLMSDTETATVLQEECVNTIRFLAADAVEKARSGHPGMPMGAATLAFVLWTQFLKHNPTDPDWADRDRIVLSCGHGSALLYALLHLTGYDLALDELREFRQWGSRTPGHPERGLTPGVETTTGPLGQGMANAVGMALAEQKLAHEFNRPGHCIVDHFTYAIVSDGDLMEGISHEAASMAGHWGLGKLICLWDDNAITIDGGTDLTVSDDVAMRFRAYGWHVVRVNDGNDASEIAAAITAARETTDRPSLVCVRTVIGFGSPGKAGTASSHGAPLGEEEMQATKEELRWPQSPTFHVPASVRSFMCAQSAGQEAQQEWAAAFDAYAQHHPDLAARYAGWGASDLPIMKDRPVFELGTRIATRAASGKALEHQTRFLENLVGGSADLTGSNKTLVRHQTAFERSSLGGHYLYFGVREHAMAAVCNGLALHGGFRPYCGTFLVFSDYLRPALRLGALMGLPVTYVFTHDSIGVGEDGPTHQPIEHVMALRAIPNVTVIRPADANETVQAWQVASGSEDGPTALILTRQSLPVVSTPEQAEGTARGGYILCGHGECDALIIASGSEVAVAAEAAEALEGTARVRVVSMPSWELFEAQSATYRESILPRSVWRRVSLEAGTTLGWERYVGDRGTALGIDRFGASAPGHILFEKLGITTGRVVEAVRALLSSD